MGRLWYMDCVCYVFSPVSDKIYIALLFYVIICAVSGMSQIFSFLAMDMVYFWENMLGCYAGEVWGGGDLDSRK
jgi:hypothetical protein